ncbi:hypothetical protein BKA70DRAFT_1525895 [Coprinopsis sp. MPI-PUGE-AT-0042]|nr:hypothetical protein BKA70DRAFT_1525895 [Coprinopsis sp. MPI-PUGE-AT-0042]
MADDFHAIGRGEAFSPPQPPSPPLKPGDRPQNYGSLSPSEPPSPYDGLDTNPNPHQPFHGVWPPLEHPPLLPTQMITQSTTSAVIPASNAGLFQGGSDNALHNSTASMANRDMWNLSNVHIHLPHASHGGQGSPSLPQLLRQPLSIFSYVLSTFATLVPHTAVTLDSQQYEAPYTIMPSNPPAVPSSCPDPNVSSSENNNTRATEGIPSRADGVVTTEFGNVEITLLDDLDMSTRHQPRGWYRSPDLPGGLSMDGIYIKKIYPSGHGYPCPNPCPMGPPVRIGDVGELTSTGFTTLLNLVDCQIPALQSQLASLALSDVWHDPNYFSEGQSITGGVSVHSITHMPGSSVIQDITYRCHAPQGAALAVTSTGQLNTLTGDKTHRLRLWLCEHGMELLQLLEPGRIDPLYIMTGKVTSSSWANATYSEPLPEPDNSLVLTHFPLNLPPYQWTKPGTSRNWSRSSSTVINPQGERASDQCLFLRGFLLTPAPGYMSHQAQHALRVGNVAPNPDTSEGHPNTRVAASLEGQGKMAPNRRGSICVDFYPSYRINKRLLELTNANLVITHDDDWRLRLEGPHHTSLLGLQANITTSVAGNAEMDAPIRDQNPVEGLYQGGWTSSLDKQQESQVEPIQGFHEAMSAQAGSINVASRDSEAVQHHGEKPGAIKVLQQHPTVLGQASEDTEASVKTTLTTFYARPLTMTMKVILGRVKTKMEVLSLRNLRLRAVNHHSNLPSDSNQPDVPPIPNLINSMVSMLENQQEPKPMLSFSANPRARASYAAWPNK